MPDKCSWTRLLQLSACSDRCCKADRNVEGLLFQQEIFLLFQCFILTERVGNRA